MSDRRQFHRDTAAAKTIELLADAATLAGGSVYEHGSMSSGVPYCCLRLNPDHHGNMRLDIIMSSSAWANMALREHLLGCSPASYRASGPSSRTERPTFVEHTSTEIGNEEIGTIDCCECVALSALFRHSTVDLVGHRCP